MESSSLLSQGVTPKTNAGSMDRSSNWYYQSLPVSIDTDTPIKVYAWFCLSTAKSKFSLVSPVAD